MNLLSTLLRTHHETRSFAGVTWYEVPEVCTEAADTIDAMTEALVEAREQISILQDRLGIKDTGHGTLSIIDAALASIKRGSNA